MTTSETTIDTSALPDYAPVPRSAIGPALNEQGYYVGRVMSAPPCQSTHARARAQAGLPQSRSCRSARSEDVGALAAALS